MKERKSQSANFRLTETELERVDKQIRPTGLTRSAYIRMALLEKLRRDEAAETPSRK